MPKQSAGLLLFRKSHGQLEVLLVHPGGPFWSRKDDGAWGIPKGEINRDEEPLDAAKREFQEETGGIPTAPFLPLGMIRQKSGKHVHGWAFQGEFDPAELRSITFEMEWPPKSGHMKTFPEIDRAEFFDIERARTKIIPAQAAFLDALVRLMDGETAKRDQLARAPGR